MEADVLNALTTLPAFMPGGRDRDGNLLIVIPVPFEQQTPWAKTNLDVAIRYYLAILSNETIKTGFAVILDAQKCLWRVTRQYMRQITHLLGANLNNFLVLRSDAFWDKNRVENCTKTTHKKGEPNIISKSRLTKYFDANDLPEDLGGTLSYNHERWMQNRIQIEEFRKSYDKAISDLDNLHITLLDNKSIRASETDRTLKACSQINSDVQKYLVAVMDNGNKLINYINELHSTKKNLQQDILDGRESIKLMLNDIEKRQTDINESWVDLEKNIEEVRELAALEDGVAYVTNWILTTAEIMLNAQLKIGYDVTTCEKLRLEHEILELQCWKTYGFYAELLYKIDNVSVLKDSFAHKDLISQRDFMDFVCRSFAQRLERRRNVLITSVRFYRLVSEYFDQTSEVFQSLIMGDRVDDYDLAKSKLLKLKDSQHSLDLIEKEIIKEGEKLSDVLLMPVKDALGRDIEVDYREDIENVRDILDATIARSKIFVDSVELQKLTLEQITHFYAYELDAAIAIKWMNDLYNVMIKSHTHIGCNVHEIQGQKDEHQIFLETAKGIYSYCCQLLNAAMALRQSCKLETDKNVEMSQNIQDIWKKFQIISQEQMTRLRVSAVFHRSVEEHCTKLYELKDNVLRIDEVEDINKRKLRLRKHLATRERLLVEIGRMVRLGKLLKTRLKEPFLLDDRSETMSSEENTLATCDNILACEAISCKLTKISHIAESLDSVLRDVQGGFDELDDEIVDQDKKADTLSSNHSDDWSFSVKSSTEDEFFTASDCTPQSRSSSYHTASSECRASPWWGESTERSSLENDSSDDPEAPTIKLLSGIVMSTSTAANLSFDDSENSFRTPTSNSEQSFLTPPTSQSEQTDSDEHSGSPANHHERVNSNSTSNSLTINRRENLTVSLSPEEFEQIENEFKSEEVKPIEVRESPATDECIPIPKGMQEISGLTYYYQNIITKHAVKGCM